MSIYSSAFPFRRHALALALALASGASSAATINVSGACTLVNAINNANSDTDTDGAVGCPAGSGADILNLEANSLHTLTAVNNTTSQGNNGLPVVSSTITINGNGATIAALASSTPPFRLFEVAATGNLTIDHAQLTGGGEQYCGHFGAASGGNALFNSGSITLTNSTISENSATSAGCTIANNSSASLTLTSSTISGNSTSALAIGNIGVITLNDSTISSSGGIEQNYSGSITLNDSTFSGNGGGFFVYSRGFSGGLKVTLNNSTISDNRGGIRTYGYYTFCDITLNNSTFSDNDRGISCYWGNLTANNSTISGNNQAVDIWNGTTSLKNSTLSGNGGGLGSEYISVTNSTVSGNGGGIYSMGGGMSLTNSTVSGNGRGIDSSYALLTNSVIANNSGGDCDSSRYDTKSYITWRGANLIGDGSCGGSPLSGDPKLRTLLDNGGPTLTHALPGDSPAIAAADPTLCEAADQRGVRRPHSCDLGAFERKSKIPESVAPLVAFFDAQVESNGLSGHVAGETVDRRIALRNQLLTAGDYLNRHLKTDACAQLTRTLGYIDPDNTPEASDYVTGSGGGLFIDEINALRDKWSCS